MRITTKFGENFATFFEGAREGNWANLSWTKVTLEYGGFAAAGETPVFRLLKRNGKVFVTVVPNCSKEELMPIIHGKILAESTIHTDD